MKYTQIPATTFQNIQLNAGILTDGFTPTTGVIGRLLRATTGGVNFKDSPEYKDFGEDIDNCPKNMKELKKIDSREITMSGTFVTVDAATLKTLIGPADVDAVNATHIIPRNDLLDTDFKDIWWIGDYSDVNTGAAAGFCAIHLMNALNTDGFQIQSTDKGKGQFAFNFTGHYSMNAQDVVPYEVFLKQGGEEPAPSVLINTHSISIAEGDTVQLTAETFPAGETVSWDSASDTIATVTSGGVVEGATAGNTIITASITVDGVTYTDTCTVVVTAAEE